MKRRDKIKELEQLDAAGLRDRCRALAEELMKLRFRKAAGRLEHPHRLLEVRKDLARAETFLSRTALSQTAAAK